LYMTSPNEPVGGVSVANGESRGRQDAGADPLDAFPTEAQVSAAVAAANVRRRWLTLAGWAALGLVCFVAVLVAVWSPASNLARRLFGPSRAAATLVVQSTPAGWEVTEGDRVLGKTPLTVSLPPGRHALRLRYESSTRDLDVTLEAGATVVHHLDVTVAPVAGALRVDSVPPGARVSVDGVPRGTTPAAVRDLAPGEHTVAVAVADGNRVVIERVTVEAGVVSSLVVPMTPPGGAADAVGWATIASPIELQVFEADALIGSSRNQRIMLIPGRHTLRLVNAATGYETTAPVRIDAGVVARVTVTLPNGTISVNAVPWAEVLLDGKTIGETPIANYAVPIGPHELVLRNPRFAEQRRTVVVTLGTPVRLGVDLRQ
jgi:hypothetical protein